MLSIHIKAQFEDEIRRFELRQLTYSELESALRTIFRLPDSPLTVKYIDEDKDSITISSDIELQYASSVITGPLRLTLTIQTVNVKVVNQLTKKQLGEVLIVAKKNKEEKRLERRSVRLTRRIETLKALSSTGNITQGNLKRLEKLISKLQEVQSKSEACKSCNTITLPESATETKKEVPKKDLKKKNGPEKNGLKKNGLKKNGLKKNGLKKNGLKKNGLKKNGLKKNGLKKNGLKKNGLKKNGLKKNGLKKKNELKKSLVKESSPSPQSASEVTPIVATSDAVTTAIVVQAAKAQKKVLKKSPKAAKTVATKAKTTPKVAKKTGLVKGKKEASISPETAKMILVVAKATQKKSVKKTENSKSPAQKVKGRKALENVKTPEEQEQVKVPMIRNPNLKFVGKGPATQCDGTLYSGVRQPVK